MRACFWIIFVFLIYFLGFLGFPCLDHGFEISFQFGIICPIFPSFSCELGSFVAYSCFSEVFPLCLCFSSISRQFLLCFGLSIWHSAFGTLFSGQRFHMSHEKYPFTFHNTGCLIGALTMAYYNPHITAFLIPYIYPKQPGFCSLLTKLASTVTLVTPFECWFYKANLSCGEPGVWVHWYVY